MNDNELEWLARLRAGEPEAVAWCYRRHASRLLTLATRLLGERADAEDVIHDLFSTLPTSLAKYEERGAFTAWLRQLLVRLALQAKRRERRRNEVAGHLLAQQPAPHSPIDDSLLVERAVRSLSAPLRQVFVLRVVEGFSHADIARLLDIEITTSEVRLSRALKALRGLLGEP